jgi:DNA (cytosine-5)-methyltransferase 1
MTDEPRRPKLLDLFCGAGGASVGYNRAGFDVTGCDLEPMPNYPFEFHQGDALEFLADHWQEFDCIAASPPCQASSALTKGTNRVTKSANHFDLIPATRAALLATGLPFVIENVQGAQVRRDLTLCGEMFGLGVIRHRYFEISGFAAMQPTHIKHRGRVRGWRHGVLYEGPYWQVYGEGGQKGTVAQWREAMGIDWTWERREIAEAIPPNYSTYVGAQLMSHLQYGMEATA